MAFALNVVTSNARELTARLNENSIPFTLWNAEACASSRPVEAELGFECREHQDAARDILGL
jgi:hypothetical protein